MSYKDKIRVEKIGRSRVDDYDLPKVEFGRVHTDHMFISEYEEGEWRNLRIVPFHDLTLSPMALGLHYGQTVYEGLKAFRRNDGKVSIFRPGKHAERFNKSLERMAMPEVPEQLFMDSVSMLIDLDRAWIPGNEGGALYIRPFCFATEPKLGMKISDTYHYIVATTPVNDYYSGTLKVKVETHFARAVDGGTGFAKCGGNYGGSFYPAMKARQEGYDQVLWTDGRERKYIEESGTMNIMFIFDGKLVTPPLSSTILDGVTRDSILSLAADMGIRAEIRPVEVEELKERLETDKSLEVFGAGTAAVIAPIDTVAIEGTDHKINVGPDAVMFRFKAMLADIKSGAREDKYGWNAIL